MAGNTHLRPAGGPVQSTVPPTYRVTLDIQKIQANVFAAEGGRLSELAVRNWLRSVGFSPEGDDGFTWLADRESLGRLDRSEILVARRVSAAVPGPTAATDLAS